MELLPLVGRSTFASWAEVFLARQAKAAKIHEYSQVVPGLLQTPGYARAMLGSGQRIVHSRDLDEVVQDRLDRQKILRREKPPWMWAILDESALHHVTGDRHVMREQLEFLLEVGTSPHVQIQVLPYEGTVPAALGGSLTVLVMPSGEQLAYLEGMRGGSLHEGEDAIPYTVLYDRLHGNAISHDASADLIRTVLKEVPMSDQPSDQPNWHKSSYSSANPDNCIEVADNDVATVLVRDTKHDGRGPVLTVSPAAWSAFADFAKASAV